MGLKDFYENALHVWRSSKKPSRRELESGLRIVLLGIFILGIIGFLITIIFNFLHFPSK